MKCAIRGFEIFKTRTEYRAEMHPQLPPLYRNFYSTFEIGIGKMCVPGLFLPQVGQAAGILTQKIDADTDFVLHDFLSLEEASTLIAQIHEANAPEQGYWPIAECDANKCVVVGNAASNEDGIYLENLTLFADGTRHRKLAANIFEFVTKISYVEEEAPGYGIQRYDELYRRWGESFWRHITPPI